MDDDVEIDWYRTAIEHLAECDCAAVTVYGQDSLDWIVAWQHDEDDDVEPALLVVRPSGPYLAAALDALAERYPDARHLVLHAGNAPRGAAWVAVPLPDGWSP